MPDGDRIGRVLVDVDGTLCRNLPRICEYVDREYGLSVDPADVDEWAYEFEEIGTDIGEVAAHLLRNRTNWYVDDLDPLPGAREGLRRLSAAGLEITIVTHRGPAAHEATREWLEENDMVYDEFLEEVPPNKGAVPGDVLVDDYHGHVSDAVAEGKLGIVMDQPYNHRPEGAHLVDSWEAVVDLVLADPEPTRPTGDA